MNTSASHDTILPDLDAEALDWFVRRERGLSADERQSLARWLAADPRHGAALSRWDADWQALDDLPAAAVAHLRTLIASGPSPTEPPPARHGLRARWAAALRSAVPRPRAAGLSLCLSLSLVALVLWHRWEQAPVFEQHFSTQRGEQREVELPDGSRIRLDTATRVEVTLYRQRREVRLPEGQAVFQVRGDAQRPFDVLAGPLTVTVVGTRFAVRHTPQTAGFEGVRVAVEQGRVRVRGSPPAQAEGLEAADRAGMAELQAGQQLEADAQGHLAPVRPLAAAGIAPWRDGRLSFDDVALAQALAEFERYGPTGLVVRDATVAQLHLSGTFDPARLGNFRQALPKVLPVRLSPLGRATEIVAAP